MSLLILLLTIYISPPVTVKLSFHMIIQCLNLRIYFNCNQLIIKLRHLPADCRSGAKDMGFLKQINLHIHTRDEQTRMSEVCPCPSPFPGFSDMPVSEVFKNLVSVSESESKVKNSPGSESVSEFTSELMSVSEPSSELWIHGPERTNLEI